MEIFNACGWVKMGLTEEGFSARLGECVVLLVSNTQSIRATPTKAREQQ